MVAKGFVCDKVRERTPFGGHSGYGDLGRKAQAHTGHTCRLNPKP